MSISSKNRVGVTQEAVNLIEELKNQHGELVFHQSGGCCDGSAPMCFLKNEFRIGEGDVHLGDIAGCGFYMSEGQFEYWKHTRLTIDAVPGRASGFSLEGTTRKKFITKSELLDE